MPFYAKFLLSDQLWMIDYLKLMKEHINIININKISSLYLKIKVVNIRVYNIINS